MEEFQCSSCFILCKYHLSFLSEVPSIFIWLIQDPSRLTITFLHYTHCSCLQEVKGRGFLLVSTDIASRGFDLPQTSHIYNFDLPKTATDYLHRAGRTGREPFSKSECGVTTLITEDEHFVLQRFQNELKFHCEDHPLESMFTFNL
uniref:RNA helicase n=1 Tax=Arundo donax TaxID=35708 RepID=A0A0A9DB17_ARUDO